MADPTWPSLTEGQWNIVATNVITGMIHRLKSKYKFWATYVLTGTTAPIAAVKDKSPVIFEDSNTEEISATAGIDVYIWIEDADTDTDSVVADSIMVAV